MDDERFVTASALVSAWPLNADDTLEGGSMKLVVIGGTGLIGSRLVPKLRELGHEAVAASPNTGVNPLIGGGLAEALQGASVVVDVSNSPSFEDAAVMTFFTTSTRNLLKYAAATGVRHYVALSVVGTERIPDSPYLRAKNAQETLIKGAGIPYSIVHATQFFEFIKRIADEATDGTTVRLPPVLIQPMAADDVARAIARIAVGAPLNGTVEVAGPQQFRFDELIRQELAARNDRREVVVDPHARYFGAELSERSLIPADDARLGEIRFQEWLHQPVLQREGSSRSQPSRLTRLTRSSHLPLLTLEAPRRRIDPVVSLPARGADGKERPGAAEENLSVRNRRRCQQPFTDIIAGNDLRLAPRAQNDHFARFAREIDLAISRDGRCRKQ